jgi:hypothetical protein
MTFKSFLSATGSAIGATAKIMNDVAMTNARGNLLLRLPTEIDKIDTAFGTLTTDLHMLAAYGKPSSSEQLRATREISDKLAALAAKLVATSSELAALAGAKKMSPA